MGGYKENNFKSLEQFISVHINGQGLPVDGYEVVEDYIVDVASLWLVVKRTLQNMVIEKVEENTVDAIHNMSK